MEGSARSHMTCAARQWQTMRPGQAMFEPHHLERFPCGSYDFVLWVLVDFDDGSRRRTLTLSTDDQHGAHSCHRGPPYKPQANRIPFATKASVVPFQRTRSQAGRETCGPRTDR